MLPTAPSSPHEIAAAALSTASVAKARVRKRPKPGTKPMADIRGSISSASIATVDGQRGVMAAIAGVARLRTGSVTVSIGSLVFVPATASDDEARDAVHREFTRVASSRFAAIGHAVPTRRIAVVLR